MKTTALSKASYSSAPLLRVLLVEDHADTLEVQTRLLRRNGFEVLTANSYKTGLELGRAQQWDVLVTDLNLRDGSGWDLYSELRATKSFPAVAISGLAYESDIRRSKSLGFCVHLTKPLDFHRLCDAVRECAAALKVDSDRESNGADGSARHER